MQLNAIFNWFFKVEFVITYIVSSSCRYGCQLSYFCKKNLNIVFLQFILKSDYVFAKNLLDLDIYEKI